MRRDILAELRRLGRSWYTVADLQKVSGLGRASLHVLLTRWNRAGLLVRFGPGLYRLPDVPLELDRLGNEYYFPSYLSFELALARYGILSQIPYALTFATPRRSRRLKLTDGRIEYRQLRPGLFFGYEQQNGVYVATAEKALLDLLYMTSLGRASLDATQLNLRPVGMKVLLEFARRFPERTRRLAVSVAGRAREVG